jgi:hypothetical protein
VDYIKKKGKVRVVRPSICYKEGKICFFGLRAPPNTRSIQILQGASPVKSPCIGGIWRMAGDVTNEILKSGKRGEHRGCIPMDH